MAAQERIIGGGFLIFGVAIVLILLYIFAWSGVGSQEAYEQIAGELFPAYLDSEKRGEYLEMKGHARDILAVEQMKFPCFATGTSVSHVYPK